MISTPHTNAPSTASSFSRCAPAAATRINATAVPSTGAGSPEREAAPRTSRTSGRPRKNATATNNSSDPVDSITDDSVSPAVASADTNDSSSQPAASSMMPAVRIS